MSTIKKYRKKPIVVEAMRFWGDVETHFEAEEFTGKKFSTEEATMNLVRGEFPIETLEGTMVASAGDYIIKGVRGECYPCKPDVFDKTYEEVRDEG